MRKLTCITCPNGCALMAEQTDGEIRVSGNRCSRGVDFAVSELTHPMRTISGTMRTVFPELPVVPVRVSAEIPKERIFDVMHEISRTVVKTRMRRGDVVIENVLGLGADVIVTGDMMSSKKP